MTERTIDPESRVVISTDSEERTGSSEGGRGDVTVASDLPDGEGSGENRSSSQEAETRERVNYEVSETRREVEREPGDIRRLTVAVLVDGVPGETAEGTATVVPRGEEEIEALRELVASAVGFDEARGDSITIRSMPFGSTEIVPPEPGPGLTLADRLDPMRLVQIGVAALVAIVLGLFVLRPILAGRRAGPLPALPASGGEVLSPDDADYDGAAGGKALITTNTVDFDLMGSGSGEAVESEAEGARVRRLIEDHREESMEVLRGWLEAPEPATEKTS